MTNLAIITGQLGKGGQEKQLLLLLKDSGNFNTNIILVNWSGLFDMHNLKQINNMQNVKYVSLGEKPILTKLREILSISHGCSHLISFTSYLNLLICLLSIIGKKTFFGSARITVDIELKKPMGWFNLLMVPNLICNSRKALAQLNKWSLFREHSILLNRVNKLDIPSNINLVSNYDSISVSTVNERKNLQFLIELALHRKKLGKSFKHIHLGDGPLLKYYQELIILLELGDLIEFHGKSDDVYKFLLSTKIFLHFSYYEGTPNAMLEALSSGCFVIATESGDVSNLVVEGVSGSIQKEFDKVRFDELYDKYLLKTRLSDNLPNKYYFKNDGSYFNSLMKIID